MTAGQAPRRGGGRRERLLPIGIGLLVVVACNGRVVFDERGCDQDSECVLPSLQCDVASATCVACTTDDHCAMMGTGFNRCDMALHRCVECGLDADCGTGRGCEGGHCETRCQEEGASPACPTASGYCEGEVGYCVECGDDLPTACASSSAAGPICNPAGRCVSCLSDTNCPAAAPRCDPFSGRCLACLHASDCPSSAPLCDPTIGRCVSS